MIRRLAALWTGSRSLLALLLTVTSPLQAAESPPHMSAAECAVFQREASFARTVERSDEAAFAEHVHPHAVFLGGKEPARGREAVVRQWARIIRNDGVQLRWRAHQVVIGATRDIAFSTGPSYFERLGPEAGVSVPRFLLNHFFSVWQRDSAGVWRVLYDGGVVKASTNERAEVDAHMNVAPADCPN